MTQRLSFSRRSTIWLWIATVALAAALPYALKISADRDLWWHVRTGELILSTGSIPTTDHYSFTAGEASWTNHEWLSDVILAGLFSSGADRALSIWRSMMLLAVCASLAALLWTRCRRPLPVLGAVLLLSPLVKMFINMRPHGYTYLFALLMLLIAVRARERPRLWFLAVPLLALWVNLHGGFLVGVGMLGMMLGERLLGLDRKGARPPVRERIQLCLVGVLALAATLVNPYGAGLYPYLARELGANHSLILEWRGIWQFPEHRVQFVLLALSPLVAIAIGRRWRPLSIHALWLVSVYLCWTHGRFLILLALFSAVACFSAMGDILKELGRGKAHLLDRLERPRWAWSICGVVLLAAAAQFGVDLQRKGLRLQLDARYLPVEASEFLMHQPLGNRLLTRLDWGGYAIWHLHPRYRVAADGRNLTVYESEFVDRLLRAYDEGRYATLAKEIGADVIMSESAGPTFDALEQDRDWRRIHIDRVAAVYVPRGQLTPRPSEGTQPATMQPASERFYFP